MFPYIFLKTEDAGRVSFGNEHIHPLKKNTTFNIQFTNTLNVTRGGYLSQYIRFVLYMYLKPFQKVMNMSVTGLTKHTHLRWLYE